MGGLWTCPVCGERNLASRDSCFVCEKNAEKRKELEEEWESGEGVIMTTTPTIEGFEIAKYLGIITAESAAGINILSDLATALTDTFGGSSHITQEVLRDIRNQCLMALRKKAQSRGGNAIVGVELKYSQFSGKGKSMIFLVAYGTVVFGEKNTTKQQ